VTGHSHNIYVGNQGAGTLTISNAGTVVNNQSAYIAASQGELTTSSGTVTVTGSSSVWQVGNTNFFASAHLFIGGNGTSDGGTALLSITNGGRVNVSNNSADYSVRVGPSGTLTGNGTP
jgi:hypothetical protein